MSTDKSSSMSIVECPAPLFFKTSVPDNDAILMEYPFLNTSDWF